MRSFVWVPLKGSKEIVTGMYMVVSQNKGPQNTIVPIIGTPKKVPPILGNPHIVPRKCVIRKKWDPHFEKLQNGVAT